MAMGMRRKGLSRIMIDSIGLGASLHVKSTGKRPSGGTHFLSHLTGIHG